MLFNCHLGSKAILPYSGLYSGFAEFPYLPAGFFVGFVNREYMGKTGYQEENVLPAVLVSIYLAIEVE